MTSIVSAVPWAVAAVGTGLSIGQVTGWSRHRWLAILQSLTPVVAVSAVPVTVIGVRRRRPLLVAAGATTLAVLGAVIAPATRRSTLPSTRVVPPAGSLSIAHCNMLYLNADRSGRLAAALLETGADVLAMSEITEQHRRSLELAGACDVYPYRVGRVAPGSDGIVIWSRHPLHDVCIAPMDARPGIVATVAAPDGPIRVVAAHPDPPTLGRGFSRWGSSLAMIGATGASAGPPTVIVADLNASRWHAELRDLLGTGWRDAHELAGRGLSPSWPIGRRTMPPFIRLDHALLRDDIELLDLVDFDAPGSDHRPFVVTVAARCARSARAR